MADIAIEAQNISGKIYNVRDKQVMLDRDLAELYGVETKRINEAVRNNPDKFPLDFYFELNKNEFENLRTKISTTDFSKTRTNPKVFTEQGIYMLATILKSKTATSVTVAIMRIFVNMRNLISHNSSLFNRLDTIESRQFQYKFEADEKFNKLFKAIEDKSIKPTEGIFYDGQIFDAWQFIAGLIKEAKESIILIDNYLDDSVLVLLTKRQPEVHALIYTHEINKRLQLDIRKHNKQYNPIDIRVYKKAHDRFLIIDKETVYHIGASLKDLGKKWFAFSRINIDAKEMIDKLH
jgi:ORF6N domain-containing protein